MPVGEPFLCPACVHNRRDGTCDAFPKGIPAAILGGADHRNRFQGDNGIQFEMIDGFEKVVELYDEMRVR